MIRVKWDKKHEELQKRDDLLRQKDEAQQIIGTPANKIKWCVICALRIIFSIAVFLISFLVVPYLGTKCGTQGVLWGLLFVIMVTLYSGSVAKFFAQKSSVGKAQKVLGSIDNKFIAGVSDKEAILDRISSQQPTTIPYNFKTVYVPLETAEGSRPGNLIVDLDNCEVIIASEFAQLASEGG